MVAGLFCIGIAGGYLLRIFKKEYFFRVLATGLLSIFLAVLPMGIAFYRVRLYRDRWAGDSM